MPLQKGNPRNRKACLSIVSSYIVNTFLLAEILKAERIFRDAKKEFLITLEFSCLASCFSLKTTPPIERSSLLRRGVGRQAPGLTIHAPGPR